MNQTLILLLSFIIISLLVLYHIQYLIEQVFHFHFLRLNSMLFLFPISAQVTLLSILI